MILTKKRLYSREEPTKDAKLIIIYCEGKKEKICILIILQK